ncbi:uncharacterized protein LOC113467561 [Diaphorina citri]|uniref:Uncharacterized protein LOC113467561 n=1 Tax=Diaphorina citri TaxID=121845 RepID=A0A3Q0ITM3_DIACI|nr:uncharacterized protein LOC113467561 [Diaphorina citri]
MSDPLSFCCNKKCFSQCQETDLSEIFTNFLTKSKLEQDCYLSSCMVKVPLKRCIPNPKTKNRTNQWQYVLRNKGEQTKVCRHLFLKVFQIKEKRLRIIQNKLLSNSSFKDRRALPKNADAFILLKEHVGTMLSSSNDSTKTTKNRKLSFKNPGMSLQKLFVLFKDYYRNKTKRTLDLSYKTYCKYFKDHYETFFQNM